MTRLLRFPALVVVAMVTGVASSADGAALDQRPVLQVASPLQGQVARPLVHVVVSCVDDNPAGCVRITVSDCPTAAYAAVVVGGSSADVFVHPCGRRVEISGTDSAGQDSILYSVAFLQTEDSPGLRTIASADGEIVDLRDSRIAFVHNYSYSDYGSSPPPVLWVQDFVSGAAAERIDPPAGFGSPFSAFLSPHGAVFLAQDSTTSALHVFERRDGTTIDLGPYGAYLNHNERYAVWVSDGVDQRHLVIRDLLDGTSADMTLPYRIVNPRPGPNGDVVFMASMPGGRYDIGRYRGGALALLTSDTAYLYVDPVTDGDNVSYWRYSLAGTAVLLYDTIEQVLADPGDFPARLANGWVGYYRKLGPQTWETFRRTPAGVVTAVTSFGANSTPSAIAPNGELIVRTSALDPLIRGYYLSVPGKPLRKFANDSAFLEPYYAGGRWLFTVGGSVLEMLDSCTTIVAPGSRAYGAPGGTGIVTISTNGDACAWAVVGLPSWITVYYGASGTGNGTVRVGVSANTGAARTATLMVAGHSVSVTQSASGTLVHTRGDFSGDAHADRAVFRPYGGQWIIEGLLTLPWGQPWSIPVPADYDGDGITDIAAFTPDTGVWAIRGQQDVAWG
ncbi:MAG: BACON domain-containing protein, partial [Vicinamibacterales bacterium]